MKAEPDRPRELVDSSAGVWDMILGARVRTGPKDLPSRPDTGSM